VVEPFETLEAKLRVGQAPTPQRTDECCGSARDALEDRRPAAPARVLDIEMTERLAAAVRGRLRVVRARLPACRAGARRRRFRPELRLAPAELDGFDPRRARRLACIRAHHVGSRCRRERRAMWCPRSCRSVARPRRRSIRVRDGVVDLRLAVRFRIRARGSRLKARGFGRVLETRGPTVLAELPLARVGAAVRNSHARGTRIRRRSFSNWCATVLPSLPSETCTESKRGDWSPSTASGECGSRVRRSWPRDRCQRTAAGWRAPLQGIRVSLAGGAPSRNARAPGARTVLDRYSRDRRSVDVRPRGADRIGSVRRAPGSRCCSNRSHAAAAATRSSSDSSANADARPPAGSRNSTSERQIVCATSDRGAAERVRAAELAMAQAVALRARGLHVVLILDSLARYAAALRELRVASGEPVGRGGYPPTVFAALARLLERAGNAQGGSVTAIATVLVDGVDEREPVADAARAILDGHVTLSDELARRGHYPAIDILRSTSRTMREIVAPEHAEAGAPRPLGAGATRRNARPSGARSDAGRRRATRARGRY